MAVCYISEYERMPEVVRGMVVVGLEPEVATQTVAIGVEAKSALFNVRTKFVRIHVDAICSLKFGPAPTATTSHKRLAANQTEYFGVTPGGLDKVSVISNT